MSQLGCFFISTHSLSQTYLLPSDLPNRLTLHHINRVLPTYSQSDSTHFFELTNGYSGSTFTDSATTNSQDLQNETQETQSFEDTLVWPGSPRVKLAFVIILNDPQLKHQTERVENKQKKNKLGKTYNELYEKMKELRESKSSYLSELDSLTSFKKGNGSEREASLWEARIINKLNEIGPELIEVEKQLNQTAKQIEEL